MQFPSSSPIGFLFLPVSTNLFPSSSRYKYSVSSRLDQLIIKMGKKSLPSFKEEFSYEERLEESRDIIAKYPDRVPVIAERYSKTDLPELGKKKFLVPRDMSVGQFIHILSTRLHLTPGKALFIFVDNTLPQTASLMDTVYESFKDEDGFLYMSYSSEKTFGYADIQIHGY